MESLYVEYRWGKADAIRYLNGLKPKIKNERPIISTRGENQEPTEDQYFKGALMLNTLRSLIDDDAKWFADIHDFYQAFTYTNSMTEDVVAWWNKRTGMELGPFFGAYLKHAATPTLVLTYDPVNKYMLCSWKTDEPGFDMPIKVGDPEHWTVVQPAEGKDPKAVGEDVKVSWPHAPEDFKVASDLYYVDVERKVRQ
jgi:aminopeptidase N